MNIITGIIRSKCAAILIGVAGVGILSIFQSIIEIVRSISILGTDVGAIKEIAEAAKDGDENKIQKTVSVFKRWFDSAALVGALICIAFCLPISLFAFDNIDYALPIAVLSIGVFFLILSTGRSVIMQGLRKITNMSKADILGNLSWLVIIVPLYYFLGIKGIVPSLIANGVLLFLFGNYFYKKLNIKTIPISNYEAFRAIKTLRTGLFIVISGVIATLSLFIIRSFISRNMGTDAAGLFQSAWAITNVYLGFLLKSLGSDYFPRLSSIADDRKEVSILVNEHTYIVQIIAAPLIIGLILLAPLILRILYSNDFTPATDLLQWQMLGTLLKILAWPTAFLLLAKGKGLFYFISEIVFFGTYLGASYILFPYYNLDAFGIGYLIAYAVYLPLIMIMGYRISAFQWNRENLIMVLLNAIMIGSAFYVIRYTEYRWWLGTAIWIICILFSLFRLNKVFSVSDLRNWFRKKDS